MTKSEMKLAILDAKQVKGLTWEELSATIELSPEFTCSACLGMNSLKAEAAEAVCALLDLPSEVSTALQAFPKKDWDQIVPTDPLIYRFYEVTGVYGEMFKELIHEKFGDGIMSAIDFTTSVEKVDDPKGDRVVITLNGKFLPYKSW